MKAVLPWQHEGCTDSWPRRCIRYHIDGRYAAVVRAFKDDEDRVFYELIIYECVIEKLILKEFDTFEKAKSFADDVIRDAGVRLLPEHMMVLK